MWTIRRGTWYAYGLAVATSAAAVALFAWELGSLIPDHAHLLPLMLGVIPAACCGRGPGFLAAALTATGAAAVGLGWTPAQGTFDLSELASLALLGVMATATIDRLACLKGNERAISSELCASRQRYQGFIAQSSEGIWRLNFEPPVDTRLSEDEQVAAVIRCGRLAEGNDAMARMLGFTGSNDIIGLRLFELYAPGDPQLERTVRAALRNNYRLDGYETRLRDREGRIHVFQSTLVAIVEDGRIFGAWGTQVDITPIRQAENELRQARDAAEAANREKDRFMAVLSHELRTPLTPVLTTATTLEHDDRLPADVKDSIAMIRRNVELEARLIDDLLDLTRISHGRLRLSLRAVDLHVKLKHVLEICDAERRGKQITLHLELGAAQAWVHADPARLQQVLWNLVKNAIKYTPMGGAISVRTCNPAPDRLVIEVSDDGIGIAPDQIEKIFHAFDQGPTEVGRQHGGLGLGLSICRALLDLHGGTVRVASNGLGAGSTFTVELAAIPAPATPEALSLASRQNPPHHRPQQQRRLSILLVEDHEDTARAVARLLQGCGWSVRVADTVAGALRAASAEEFDVLISDIGLPDGSGLDLMRQLLAHKPLKGICMSGFGMDEDIRMSQEAGFIEHLTKPVNVMQLRNAVLRAAAVTVTPDTCTVRLTPDTVSPETSI